MEGFPARRKPKMRILRGRAYYLWERLRFDATAHTGARILPSDPDTPQPVATDGTSRPGETGAEGTSIDAQMRPALVKYFERKCGSVEEAEDLAQDVLVRTLGHVKWETPEQARGYVFRAAVNRWRDRRRRALTHGTSVEWDEARLGAAGALDSITNEETAPERVLIGEQELFSVATALMELSERQGHLRVGPSGGHTAKSGSTCALQLSTLRARQDAEGAGCARRVILKVHPRRLRVSTDGNLVDLFHRRFASSG